MSNKFKPGDIVATDRWGPVLVVGAISGGTSQSGAYQILTYSGEAYAFFLATESNMICPMAVNPKVLEAKRLLFPTKGDTDLEDEL